jgi:uncharacterized protein (TIGR02266 family)
MEPAMKKRGKRVGAPPSSRAPVAPEPQASPEPEAEPEPVLELEPKPIPLVRKVERRIAPRYAAEIQVTLTSESQFFAGITGDISTGGVFIATYEERPIGTVFELTFTLPRATVTARGTVRWVRPVSSGAIPGLGIVFDDLPEESRDAIQSFCRSRPPLFHDDY